MKRILIAALLCTAVSMPALAGSDMLIIDDNGGHAAKAMPKPLPPPAYSGDALSQFSPGYGPPAQDPVFTYSRAFEPANAPECPMCADAGVSNPCVECGDGSPCAECGDGTPWANMDTSP